MFNRRQLIITAAAGVVGASLLAQGTSLSSAHAATTNRQDAWGAALRGALTDASAVAVPSSFTAAEAANARLWVRQEIQIAKAMAAIGAEYTFIYFWERSSNDIRPSASTLATSLEGEALYGSSLALDQTAKDELSQPYRWESAGILGRVVHESGMDSAN